MNEDRADLHNKLDIAVDEIEKFENSVSGTARLELIAKITVDYYEKKFEVKTVIFPAIKTVERAKE